MRNRRLLRLVPVALAGISLLMAGIQPAFAAKTAWVTDELRLGLYAKKGGGGKALRTLSNDVKLTVLKRDGSWARVRTPRGDSGWVKSAFLVDSPPARIELPAVQSLNKKLQESLRISQESLATARTELATLTSAHETLEGDSSLQASRLQQLEQDNQSLQNELSVIGYRLPMNWGIGVAVAMLLLGIVAGIAWLDWVIRRRHGGFRIY